MSDPKSLGELKVGEVYDLDVLLCFGEMICGLHGRVHLFKGKDIYIEYTFKDCEDENNTEVEVTAKYRREEVKPKPKCNVFNVYPGKKEFN